ncbi:hypothetical protein DRN84_03510 [Candidatus Geothermarchaeota archaeon]|nr:MAG: hypothetical protein DRN84_03510 [Candidatus Geothermarchaeota archaeon]
MLYGDYRDDIEFYKNEAKKIDGKLLEIGCGTGRVYLELLKEGIDIYRIDSSYKMLEKLREKARKPNLIPKVYQADMRNFKLEQSFKLIITFRMFLHNLTIEDQLSALKCCKEHLTRNGKLILNFFNPNPEKIVEYIKIRKR